MIGIPAGDIIRVFMDFGVPAGLAAAGLAFLILYLRTERSRSAEPAWVARLEGEMRQMRQAVESSQRACDRTIEAHHRQMERVEATVRESRTILRIMSGRPHGE